MSVFNLEINGKNKSTTKGNVDWYYGGGQEAWNSLVSAKAGVPLVIRAGKTVGVVQDGKILEYIWHPENTSDNGLVLKTPESSDDVNLDDSNVLASSKAVKIVNDKTISNSLDISNIQENIANVGIADKDGITQYTVDLFAGEKLKFENFSFNPAEKKITSLAQNITLYLDNLNGSDSSAEINNESKPFRTFTALISRLRTFTDTKIYYTIINLNASSNVMGAILPALNMRILGEPLTLNYTGVVDVTSGSIVDQGNTNFNIDFPDGNISLISTTTGSVQVFYSPFLTVSGVINKFDFSGNDGANVSRAVFSTEKTDLQIKELYTYKGIGFTARQGSTIKIGKWYANSTLSGVTASNANASNYTIEEVVLNVPNATLRLSGDSTANIGKVTGTGKLVSSFKTFYDSAEVDTTATIEPNGGKHSGEIISTHYAFYTPSLPAELILDTLTCKMQNIRVFNNSSFLRLKGNNFFQLQNNFIRAFAEVADNCVIIETGTTILSSDTPTEPIFKNHTTGTYDVANNIGKFIVNSDIHFNATSVGTTINYKNNNNRAFPVLYKEVNVSRLLNNSDIGKCLVITSPNISLTIPSSNIDEVFNCSITPTIGNNAVIILDNGVVSDNTGLNISAQETKRIGRIGTTYIIR